MNILYDNAPMLIIGLLIAAFVLLFQTRRPYAPQRRVQLWDDLPYDDPRHPQRRDVGAARAARWLQIFVIWGGIIPAIVVALLMTIISKFGTPGLNSLLVSIGIALVVSVGTFQGFIKHFLLNVSGNHAVGTKLELGQTEFDDEGFPLLGFYFSGIHPKFFWETPVFNVDLSRDVLVTEKDVPGHNSGGPITLETATGVDLLTNFSFVLRPDLWHLQNLFHAGGVDAEKVLDERTGRTQRDQFLAELFAADAAQRLSDIFADNDPEYIRRHKAEICRTWANEYAEHSNDMEERHGSHAGSFVIANTDYDQETGNRRKQEAGAIYDQRAINVHLNALGLTTDRTLWGQPIVATIQLPNGETQQRTARDASGKTIVWLQPTEKQLKDARDAVQVGAGEATKVINEIRIPGLEENQGQSIGDAFTAFFSTLLASRSPQQPPRNPS